MATWGTAISLKGPKGEDGNRIYFVTGAPTDANASANAGDVAFDQVAQVIYTRGANGWPSTGTSLRGETGINGVDGSFFTGSAAPTSDLGAGTNAIYFQASGEIWTLEKGGSWVDSNENFTGPVGPVGPVGPIGETGLRGTQTYTGSGAPSSDLTTFSPPAVAGDLYYSLGGASDPTLYVLGA